MSAADRNSEFNETKTIIYRLAYEQGVTDQVCEYLAKLNEYLLANKGERPTMPPFKNKKLITKLNIYPMLLLEEAIRRNGGG